MEVVEAINGREAEALGLHQPRRKLSLISLHVVVRLVECAGYIDDEELEVVCDRTATVKVPADMCGLMVQYAIMSDLKLEGVLSDWLMTIDACGNGSFVKLPNDPQISTILQDSLSSTVVVERRSDLNEGHQN